MKKIFQLLTFSLACTAFSGFAQVSPAPSSTQTIVQNFGLGKITLTYARPNTKGRKIFGGMEPYGTVWRTGANNATVVKFTDEVIIDGKKLPAGEYGLFTIPGVDDWTIILNKTSKQWGAYAYRQADDVLRFNVKTDKLKDLTETLTLNFINVTPTTCDLQMKWEHSGFAFHIVADVDTKVMANIDSAMKTDRKPYFEAVVYYYNNNKDLDKALAWTMEMEKNPKMSIYVPKLWEARIKLRKGDKAGAIKAAQEGVDAAAKDQTTEYVRLNNEVIAQAKK
jgi:hypothetical protein